MDGRKHTVLESGGKHYNLRLSFNALAVFEESIGPINIIIGANAHTFQGFRGLIWATINDYAGQNITLKEAGDICEDYITEKGQKAFMTEMQKIINDSGWLGKESDEPDPNPKALPK